MKCFFYFKDGNRNRDRKSAPVILQDQSKSDILGGGAERVQLIIIIGYLRLEKEVLDVYTRVPAQAASAQTVEEMELLAYN
ncbi:hypothetical protein HAX54_014655 [Datura stramonium]|uniref:Uncharacterized protein n=1 Tax=Datura stramonium TaxID=4076 RepID=A0ABS8TQH8_DATST|nr:hypothetical protein [Datura stramonium]